LIAIGSNPEVRTAVHGSIELTGAPCPGGSCNIGLAIRWRVDSFNSGGDTFNDITLVGSGEAPGARVDASGRGSFAPGQFHLTASATGSGTIAGLPVHGTQAYFFSNSDPIELKIEWAEGTFTIKGAFNLVTGPVSSPAPALRVRLNADGHLLNRPPAVVTGPNQTVECTSQTGTMVSLNGTGTDLDNNIISLLWKRSPGDRSEVVGTAPTTTLLQSLGTQTYAFQAIDGYLQTATSALTINVQDTTPPVILSPVIEVPCGWGGSCENPKVPKLCISLAGKAKDTCSERPEMVVLSVQPFLYCSGEPLAPPQQGACITADPRFWGNDISRIVYEMRYTARDESGNTSPVQTVRFKVSPGGDPSTCPDGCSEPRKIELNPCGRP
jgi:hypothetical protein